MAGEPDTKMQHASAARWRMLQHFGYRSRMTARRGAANHNAHATLYRVGNTFIADPEAVAVQLGLELRPVVGGVYRFDGAVIEYDASQPLTAQRRDVANAVAVALLAGAASPHGALESAVGRRRARSC